MKTCGCQSSQVPGAKVARPQTFCETYSQPSPVFNARPKLCIILALNGAKKNWKTAWTFYDFLLLYITIYCGLTMSQLALALMRPGRNVRLSTAD